MGCEGLDASMYGVLRAIAHMADAHGSAIVSVKHLMDATKLSRSSVFRALKRLEKRGLLMREPRTQNGHQASSRYTLVAAGAFDPQPADESRPMPLECVAGVLPLDGNDDDGLKEAIRSAIASDWDSECEAVGVLAATVSARGPAQFSSSVRARRDVPRSEARADTLSVAWEALVSLGERIVEAPNSWAYWTKVVRNMVMVREREHDALFGYDKKDKQTRLFATDPTTIPEPDAIPSPGKIDGKAAVGLVDLEDRFQRFIDALMDEGLPEWLAHMGTVRIAQLALASSKPDVRVILAGNDSKLHGFGVCPAAAREWMNIVVGGRRGPGTSVVDLNGDELREAAHRLVVKIGDLRQIA